MPGVPCFQQETCLLPEPKENSNHRPQGYPQTPVETPVNGTALYS